MREGKMILLVENRDEDITLICEGLEQAHLVNPIHNVRDVEEAIAYLLGQKKYTNREEYPLPDLILLDLKMTKVRSFELLCWIRSQQGIQGIAVVVLTSSDQMRDVREAYALGANSFLIKPGDFQNYVELGKLIREYLRKTVKSSEKIRPLLLPAIPSEMPPPANPNRGR